MGSGHGRIFRGTHRIQNGGVAIVVVTELPAQMFTIRWDMKDLPSETHPEAHCEYIFACPVTVTRAGGALVADPCHKGLQLLQDCVWPSAGDRRTCQVRLECPQTCVVHAAVGQATVPSPGSEEPDCRHRANRSCGAERRES